MQQLYNNYIFVGLYVALCMKLHACAKHMSNNIYGPILQNDNYDDKLSNQSEVTADENKESLLSQFRKLTG